MTSSNLKLYKIVFHPCGQSDRLQDTTVRAESVTEAKAMFHDMNAHCEIKNIKEVV